MGSLNGRSRRLDRASFPRALITAMMVVSLVCATTPRNARAQSCDNAVWKDEVAWGKCSCPQMATGATCEQWAVSRTLGHYRCLYDIPRPLRGNIGCITKKKAIKREMKCYVGVDWWIMSRCIGQDVGCTALLIAVTVACVPNPTTPLACPAAIAAAAACKANLLGACLAPCALNKCYADTSVVREVDVDVYSHFTGGECIGTSPPEQGAGG